MKNISVLSENVQLLSVNFSMYLNKLIFLINAIVTNCKLINLCNVDLCMLPNIYM